MFTVNRQTFKIKSRILNKQITIDQFEEIINSNNELYQLDQEVISHCIEEGISSRYLNVEQFKYAYSRNCTSVILWYEDFIRNERSRNANDLFYGDNHEYDESYDKLSTLELTYGIDRLIVLNYFYQFSVFKKDSIGSYIIVHDWYFLNLRKDFINFLNSINVPSEHSNLLPFVDALIQSL